MEVIYSSSHLKRNLSTSLYRSMRLSEMLLGNVDISANHRSDGREILYFNQNVHAVD